MPLRRDQIRERGLGFKILHEELLLPGLPAARRGPRGGCMEVAARSVVEVRGVLGGETGRWSQHVLRTTNKQGSKNK
jgi:hypothetical protein